MLLLPRNLAALHTLAAEQTRFSLGSVSLTERDGGAYVAVATDGKILLAVEGEAPASAEEYPVTLTAGAPARSALIPAAVWKDVFRTAPKKGKTALQCVAVAMGENETTFCTTNLDSENRRVTRNVEGRFPEWEKILPEPGRGTPPAVKVDVAKLAELCKVIVGMSDERVVLTVEMHKSMVVVRAELPAGQKITGLLSTMS